MTVFNTIYLDYLKIKRWFKRWLFYKRKSIEMNRAIKLADQKQQAENLQNHVMIYSDPIIGNVLEPVNKYQIETLKREGRLPRHSCMIDLQQTSIFYSTPLNRNNKSTPEEREAARKKYIKYSRKYVKGN